MNDSLTPQEREQLHRVIAKARVVTVDGPISPACIRVAKHYGPGPHKTGTTQQEAHGQHIKGREEPPAPDAPAAVEQGPPQPGKQTPEQAPAAERSMAELAVDGEQLAQQLNATGTHTDRLAAGLKMVASGEMEYVGSISLGPDKTGAGGMFPGGAGFEQPSHDVFPGMAFRHKKTGAIVRFYLQSVTAQGKVGGPEWAAWEPPKPKVKKPAQAAQPKQQPEADQSPFPRPEEETARQAQQALTDTTSGFPQQIAQPAEPAAAPSPESEVDQAPPKRGRAARATSTPPPDTGEQKQAATGYATPAQPSKPTPPPAAPPADLPTGGTGEQFTPEQMSQARASLRQVTANDDGTFSHGYADKKYATREEADAALKKVTDMLDNLPSAKPGKKAAEAQAGQAGTVQAPPAKTLDPDADLSPGIDYAPEQADLVRESNARVQADESDPDRSEFMSDPDIRALARQVFVQRALPQERAASAGVEAIAKATGAKAEGWSERVKMEGSIAEKIWRNMAGKGLEPEQAAAEITDCTRFTFTFPDEGYTAGVMAVEAALAEQGWQVSSEEGARRNYWTKPGTDPQDAYEGYHLKVQATDADGNPFVFEIQIHTPESYRRVKLAHPTYEKIRLHGKSHRDYPAWTKEVAEIWAGCPVPPGVAALEHWTIQKGVVSLLRKVRIWHRI